MDLILVNGLALHARVGDALWPKPSPKPPLQPVVISISVPYSLRLAGNSDNLAQSLNYGTLCDIAETCVNTKEVFDSIEHMAEEITAVCLKTFASAGMSEITVKVEKSRGLLHAKSIGVEITRYALGGRGTSRDVMFVRGLELSAIVGIHPWERVEKQLVTLNLSWVLSETSPQPDCGFAYRRVVQVISDVRPLTLD